MSTVNKEGKTYFGRCRCCLGYGYLNNMWEEYHNGEKIEVFGEMLIQCFALSWEHPESVEHDQICEICVQRLRNAYTFRELVIKSQTELMLEIENDKLAQTKFEVDIKDVKIEAPDNLPMESVTVTYDRDESCNEEAEGSSMDAEDIEKDVIYEDIEYLEEDLITETKGTVTETIPTRVRRKGSKNTLKPYKKLPPHERNKRYLQYTKDDLFNAMEAVRTNKMSRIEAAQLYKVPRKTLMAKLREEKKDDSGENKKKMIDKGDDNKRNAKSKEIKRNDKTKETEQVPSNNRKGVNGLVEEMNKHRDNIKSVLQCSNASMLKSHCSRGYTCCFCPEIFPVPADLKRHNLETHEDASTKAIHVKYVSDLIIKLDITGLRCIICGAKGTSLEAFMDHLKQSHNRPIHRDVKNYIIPFKFDSEKLECVVCSKDFSFFKVLSEHMNEHYTNFECPVCGRGFVNKQSLSTHSYRHQKNVGEFKCTHCSKVFDTRHKRSAHVRRIHLYRGKTRKCHICNEKFTSSPQVQNHMVKVHGAEPLVFKCGACDKAYNNSRSLNDHKKRYHLMLRPHKCTLCDMSFYSRMELNTHMVTHTKTKDFQCDICDKRFGTKCCLSQHMRSHYGIKRHKCDKCDIKYAARSKWKLHMWKKHREVV